MEIRNNQKNKSELVLNLGTIKKTEYKDKALLYIYAFKEHDTWDGNSWNFWGALEETLDNYGRLFQSIFQNFFNGQLNYNEYSKTGFIDYNANNTKTESTLLTILRKTSLSEFCRLAFAYLDFYTQPHRFIRQTGAKNIRKEIWNIENTSGI